MTNGFTYWFTQWWRIRETRVGKARVEPCMCVHETEGQESYQYTADTHSRYPKLRTTIVPIKCAVYIS